MRKIFLALVFLLTIGIVTAECITEENKAVKNGVDFPNYCADENNLVKNYCVNDTVEQDYINCNCVNDTCAGPIITPEPTCEGDTCNPTENITEPVCTPEWTCTDWNTCENGTQERTCADVNICGETGTNQRTETQDCPLVPVGTPSNLWFWVIAIVIVIVIIISILLLRKPQNKKLTTS